MKPFLYSQKFKTWERAVKRARFERAHATQRGDNVNFRFFAVRCLPDGRPDVLPFDSHAKYVYRIERTLSDYATDPRLLRLLHDRRVR